MRYIFPLLLLLLLPAERAAAYACTVTPDGKSVIVTISNADTFVKSCTVNCQFKMARGGTASGGCSKTVAAGVKDWEMCVKSTGGDKYTFKAGEENCVKQ